MSKATLNQISPHVYWMAPDGNTDRPTLGVIAGTDATLLVDAGNSIAHAHLFLEALDEARGCSGKVSGTDPLALGPRLWYTGLRHPHLRV